MNTTDKPDLGELGKWCEWKKGLVTGEEWVGLKGDSINGPIAGFLPGSETATLDGGFTSDFLRAMADFMDRQKEQ